MRIHGKLDDMISYRHAEQLLELVSTRKLLVSPQQMLHNTTLEPVERLFSKGNST